ncbi:hypothetical protein CK203_004412 [Vitis vinifera]|uniref:AB hydrolase-1 domain-containing protein n=1 Tax=Vitis vinifera TaxID=29760 RepID=A0A438KA08_VITVI|nr:hypothetical protein CK203_004412 [Vitis vinifera]
MALRHSEPVCFSHFCPARFRSRRQLRVSRAGSSVPRLRPPAVLVAAAREAHVNKPSVCTADELHRVAVADSDWSLALWRYTPSPKAERRNHPLLLLSGIGTNAIGFDLAPESSFARYLSNQGFDTWILELRGAGLSTLVGESREVKKPFKAMSDRVGTNGVLPAESPSTVISGTLVETFILLSKEKEWWLNLMTHNRCQSCQKLLLAYFKSSLDDFQKQLDLILKYNWDFDHHMKEDVPAAMEYIRTLCKPKDGKLLAIGHSMGGILLYAMLSQSGSEGRDSGLASVITLASSLDFTSSKSSLKLLLPLASEMKDIPLNQVDPAQALNVPVIPLGALLAAAHPLMSRPPYVLSWLTSLVSAQKIPPESLEKLVLTTCLNSLVMGLLVPSHEDRDGVCPPEAVYGRIIIDIISASSISKLSSNIVFVSFPVFDVFNEAETVKHIPGNLVTYKVFGEPDGPHYGHYDLVGGPSAADQVHPCLSKFLIHHDMA